MISRRIFINSVPFIAAQLLTVLSGKAEPTGNARKKILLRSSWQTVNIGDIGHTPGVLHLLEKHLPDAEVRLWAGDVGNGVKEMLLKRFPNLEIFTSADTVSVNEALALNV